MKWRSPPGIMCDCRITTKLRGKLYKTSIRPAMLYGTECQAVKKQHIYKMSVAEMGMLRWISGNKRKDGIQNEEIRLKIRMAPIDEKMRESRLRQFDYMQRREINAPVRKSELIQVKETNKKRKVEENLK